ncbi:hypothetical protein C1Y40_05761 [Mycobacterium talmoniae]|uniref:Uncharacterized protein n=1 Tax=Mycobacterium talmoniae TaxID=1858794 RepID=A0A2S8BBP3_9MYCO|nr:hypothetical protein C1Y40_05761 [Mycobacterium talmoniae]
MAIASTMVRAESSLTGHSPVWSRCSATGSAPRRASISLTSMPAHDAAPSVKPNWNAEIRSNAEPCSLPPPSISSSCSTGSRSTSIAASTAFSPSPVLSVKRGESPWATQRRYTPAKQSACCSATRIGVRFLVSLAALLIAWPYSWANTIGMAISP